MMLHLGRGSPDRSGWGYPWTELRLRSLPLLVEREVPLALLETRRTASFWIALPSAEMNPAPFITFS